MRILLVSQWYSPEPVKVVEELAQGLRRRGHDVQVLTGFPNYPAGTIYDGYRLRPTARENVGGVNVRRVALFPDHSRSAVRRFLNYGSFAASASVFAPFAAGKADVVLVYGSPATAALPGWWASRLRRIPYVVLVPDLWPEAFQAVGVRSRLILGPLEWYSRWMYRSARRVIAVSRGFAEGLVAKGVARERVRYVPMWVDPSTYRVVPPDDEMRRRLGVTRPVVILYAGHIGPAQGLETVIEAADRLRERDDVEFVFAGDGAARADLERMAAGRKLTNVRFVGSFPSGEMSRVYAAATALLVHLTDDPLFRMWIPHKIFAYMAVAKPVLCAVAGETADIVRGAGAGLVCEPGRPEQLAELVRQVAALSEEERAAMGRAGRRTVEAEYDAELLIGRIADVLEEAVERKQ